MQRTALSTALFLMLAAGMAGAQQTTPPAGPVDAPATTPARTPDPQKQTQRLARELGLTADQQARVEPILADRDQKIATIRGNTALAPADAQKQLRAVQKSSREQLGSILTPTQIDQWKAMQKGQGGKGQMQALPQPPAS